MQQKKLSTGALYTQMPILDAKKLYPFCTSGIQFPVMAAAENLTAIPTAEAFFAGRTGGIPPRSDDALPE